MTHSPEPGAVRRELERTAGYVLTAATALCVVTCSAATQATGAPWTPAEPTPSPPPAQSTGIPAESPAAPRAPLLEGEDRAVAAPLARFRSALGALQEGSREEHVRIAWLGDSHAAADFWPNQVRDALQARFGNGGPGFVYVGLKVYRHEGVALDQSGSWRHRPRAPSLWTMQGDGVYGLGGIRTIPMTAASVAVLELGKDAVVGPVHWTVTYRLPSDRSGFRLRWPGGSKIVDSETEKPDAHGVASVSVETEVEVSLRIDGAAGEPEIFGVVIESGRPGVVVDTLGINGARIGTPLAWNAEAWAAAVAARRPQLAVLAYGTNEAGDAVAPWRYGPQYDELVGRLRRAQPDIDCWILGPTDRAAPDWQTLSRVVEIDAVQRQAAERLGCAFTSTLAVMGGEGSLKRWADQSPPLAGRDRVHLTPRGYKTLGAANAGQLFEWLDVAPP